jgi:hypothetical protein
MKTIMDTIQNMTIHIEGNKNDIIVEEFDLNDNAFSNSDEPTVENDDDLINIEPIVDKKKKKKKKNSKVCVDEC